jgi:hypothetical protein
MTIRDNRSMNYELSTGAVEGKVRFLRPNAVDADESHALQRSGALHTQHYGSMGVSANNAAIIMANRPDSSAPYLPYLPGGE